LRPRHKPGDKLVPKARPAQKILKFHAVAWGKVPIELVTVTDKFYAYVYVIFKGKVAFDIWNAY
jgi:hypothetical protein